MAVAVVLWLLGSGLAGAQQQSSGHVFSCKDARGHTLTSDRPIPDCVDREQRELRSTGGVLRTLGPTYSEAEAAAREAHERQESLNAAERLNERRRELALRMRYPTESTLEHERDEALAQADAITRIAKARTAELIEERKKIDDELEFYQRDIARAPDAVRRRLEDNMRSLRAQVRLMRAQSEERKQLNARFDEERTRLVPYWHGTTLSAR